MPLMKYFCSDLTLDMRKKAEDELGETEEVRNKCLAEIKNLIKDEPDFYPCMDDHFLLRFLRARKFNTGKAFESLRDYYVYKLQYSGIITDLLPSDIKHVFDHGEATILEHRNHDGSGIFVGRVGYYDPQIFTSDGQITMMLLATEVGLEIETTQIAGYSAIVDFENFGLAKAIHFGNPKAMYRILMTILKSIPCRIKSFHVVNEAKSVHELLNVVMHIIPPKLKQRLHFHGNDLKSLHDFICPEVLPEEYGGQQGPLKNYARVFGEMVLSHEEYFKEMNKYGFKNKTF